MFENSSPVDQGGFARDVRWSAAKGSATEQVDLFWRHARTFHRLPHLA